MLTHPARSRSMLHLLLLGLLALSVLHVLDRRQLLARGREDWAIDAIAQGSHFLLIPFVQAAVVYPLLALTAPGLKSSLEIGWPAAIVANMLIDYGWYWNHRLFHAQTPLWRLHSVHHESERLDILATPRNSLVSPFLMVYFWLQPVAVFLARDPAPFLTVAGFGLLVNFWGHTQLNLRRGSLLRRCLSTFLIQPEDHYWHHSAEGNTYCNFATVFNFWDRLHGTWHQPDIAPARLGFPLVDQPFWRRLVLPHG